MPSPLIITVFLLLAWGVFSVIVSWIEKQRNKTYDQAILAIQEASVLYFQGKRKEVALPSTANNYFGTDKIPFTKIHKALLTPNGLYLTIVQSEQDDQKTRTRFGVKACLDDIPKLALYLQDRFVFG